MIRGLPSQQFWAYSGSTYTIPLPEGHRFPMYKYAGVRYILEQQGLKILEPSRPSWEQVERVHTHEYLRQLRFGDLEPKELRLLGFPWSEMLVERALRAAGGTLQASFDALECGLGINLAGGTHHAYPDHGEGFCTLNDVAIAAKELLEPIGSRGFSFAIWTCIKATAPPRFLRTNLESSPYPCMVFAITRFTRKPRAWMWAWVTA